MFQNGSFDHNEVRGCVTVLPSIRNEIMVIHGHLAGILTQSTSISNSLISMCVHIERLQNLHRANDRSIYSTHQACNKKTVLFKRRVSNMFCELNRNIVLCYRRCLSSLVIFLSFFLFYQHSSKL